MLNVFIDTNIYLNFFGYSADHLDKLETLVSAVKNKKLKLFIPKQVIDEFDRNREAKLKDVIRNLEAFRPTLNSPVMCHAMEEMIDIQEHLKATEKSIEKLITKLKGHVKEKSFKADNLIKEIFKIKEDLIFDNAITERAKFRYEIGNPPGKNNSLGDATNWECLLQYVPTGEDLYFIGSDKDYVSVIDKNEFSPFLCEEWHEKKKSKIFYYDLLSKFLKHNLPDTKITDREIKEERNIVEKTLPFSRIGKYLKDNPEITPALVQNYLREWGEKPFSMEDFFLISSLTNEKPESQ